MEGILEIQKKAQLKWGVATFLSFLRYASKRGILSMEHLNHYSDILKEKQDLKEGEAILNQAIQDANQKIKSRIDASQYAPFPSFEFVDSNHQRSSVLSHLDMVERTLTEIAEAGLIDWDQEGIFFTEVVKIFSQIENNTLHPFEGLAQLAVEVEKINEKLAEQNRLPRLDLSAYE